MNVEEKLDIQKKQLIERLGVIMEKKHQMAPLAARVMSTLILSGQNGVTFEMLVKDLNASKSTISTHLDSLQATRRVKYYTKSGDRKRYFVINPNLIVEFISETIAGWETEEIVQKEILEYKQKINELNEAKGLPLFDLDFQKSLLVFLREATTSIKKLKSEINKKNQ